MKKSAVVHYISGSTMMHCQIHYSQILNASVIASQDEMKEPQKQM